MVSSCSPIRNAILRGRANYSLAVDFPSLPNNKQNGKLLHHEIIDTITKKEIIDFFPEKKGIDIRTFVRHDVQIIRVFYSSDNRNEDLVVSGLVAIPIQENQETLQHYQYHHGTLLPISLPLGPVGIDAPSLYDGKEYKHRHFETRIMGLVPASFGYFTSLPDYAGYSISKDKEHSYGIARDLAQQSVDMILASNELAQQLGFSLDKKLLLSGWSEGAYASLATQKLLEEKYTEYPVLKNALLAGPFHFTRFIESVINEKRTMFLPIYNWAFYNAIVSSDLDLEHKKIWKYKVNNQLDALAVPSEKPKRVYKKQFLKEFTHNPQNVFRNYAISELNLHKGWQPKGIIHFYTGTEDEIVPSFNSMDAYEGLKAEGAEVYFTAFEGESHLSATQDFLLEMMQFYKN